MSRKMTQSKGLVLVTSLLRSFYCSSMHHMEHGTIDRFHSIFSLWQLEGKGSCDVDIDQSAGSMVI